MRKCPNCNALLIDNEAKFCIKCGATLNFNSKENKLEKITTQPPAKKKIPILLTKKSKLQNIKSGKTVNLTKVFPKLSNFNVNISWECEKNFELDFLAFMMNSEDAIESEENLIFYNNPVNKSGGIELIDTDANSKKFKIDFSKLPSGIAKISFILSIDDDEETGKTFADVHNITLSIEDEGNKILGYTLNGNFDAENVAILGEIYLQDDCWIFKALEKLFDGGLVEVCENFGLEVQ